MPPRFSTIAFSHASRTVEGAFSTYSSPPRATSAQNFRASRQAFLYAFDLLELDGTDLRREPLEVRKTTLASVLRQAKGGVRLNEYLAHDCGLTVLQHACALGCEGIVSKRLGSRYRSGRSPDWLKFKNPNAPAVRREAEEDWTR